MIELSKLDLDYILLKAMNSKWPILTMVAILWFRMASIEIFYLISLIGSYRIVFYISNPHLFGHRVHFYYDNWIYNMIIFFIEIWN